MHVIHGYHFLCYSESFVLRKLFATPPSSPAPRPIRDHTQPRQERHHLVPYRCFSTPSIDAPALTLPARSSQSAPNIDDEAEWVIVLNAEQETLQKLKEEQKKLRNQLQHTPRYCAAFNYQLTALAKLAEDEIKPARAIIYTERANTILTKMLSRPGFYQGCMQHAQRTAHMSLPEQDYLRYATAVQELLSLETIFLETYQPSQPRYQTLVSLGKRLLTWKALNAAIDKYIATQQIPPDKVCLLRVSIWYKVQTYQRFPFPIEEPAHVLDISQICLRQILNAAGNPLQDTLTLSQQLYTLSCWKHYILIGYQYDPTIKGKPLEKVCINIEKILKEALSTEVLPDIWPSLNKTLEKDIADKFALQGLYPTLEEEAITSKRTK